MHKMLQEQANQIETLAFTLKKRISLHAPTDYEIKMDKKLSAVDQKLKELFSGDDALDIALVRDTMAEKVKLLERIGQLEAQIV
jgi:hypothetical protein